MNLSLPPVDDRPAIVAAMSLNILGNKLWTFAR
jgi:hypothetical protein